MHPDAAAFERAILADPADQTARLVYADWCDEHDDPAFAAALRSDDFADVAATAAAAELPLRQAWDAAQGVKQLSGTVGAIGLTIATFAPMLRLLGGSLRAAALGAALSGAPARPLPLTSQPQVRQVS